MDINFELYKIFYYAAHSGSFTGAAEKLFISQSAVSQAVKNLEEKIGSQLFVRKSRTFYLTREGELLFKHIEQAFNFIRTAENKIHEIQTLASGEIRIGASDTVCKYHLIPYIEGFIKKYPGIKIQLINRTSSQILGILKNGLIDFGIVTLPVHDYSIRVEEFLSVEDIFVASNRFYSLKGKTSELNELSDYPFLMLQKNSSTRQNLDNHLKQAGMVISPEIELESVDLLVEFAKIGFGIAHVLKASAAQAIEKGELFEVKTSKVLPPRILGIITIDKVPLSRSSGEFINFLKT